MFITELWPLPFFGDPILVKGNYINCFLSLQMEKKKKKKTTVILMNVSQRSRWAISCLLNQKVILKKTEKKEKLLCILPEQVSK